MMTEETFQQIKEDWLAEARNGSACKEGYAQVLRADNMGALCAVLFKHWSSFIASHCAKAFDWLDRNYEPNKDDFNAFGLYYNEGAETGFVIVNKYSEMPVQVGGDAVCHVYDKAKVSASWHANVYAHNLAQVYATDNTRVQLFDTATAYAKGRSQVDGNDANVIYAYDACTVNAGGATVVKATSWNRITAYGDAVVYASTKRKIKGNVMITKNV